MTATEAPQTDSLAEKINQIRSDPDGGGPQRIYDLLKTEIGSLKREYDRIDMRLAVMESWIHFTNSSPKTESGIHVTQAEEQCGLRDMAEDTSFPVDPALCLTQVNQPGSLHPWTIKNEMSGQ